MAIISISTDSAGQIGFNPRSVRIVCTDSYAKVTAAGYLNPEIQEGYTILPTDFIFMAYGTNSATFGIFTPSISNGIVTLVAFAAASNVLLPVVSGDFANFSGTSGLIADDGYAPSDPAAPLVVMNYGSETISHIACFADANGTLFQDAATAINGGNISAGDGISSSGSLISIPSGLQGSLALTAINNTGNTLTTISNAAMGQASTISIPDPANAVGRFLVGATATPFVSGNFPKASGTGGLMVDSGLSVTHIQNSTNIKAAISGNIGGSGAGPLSVSVAGLTSSSIVVADIQSSSNPASVIAVVAGSASFAITLSADPGASCIINYIAFIAAQ